MKPRPIPFVDLKTQHERLKPRIEARVGAVLEHCRFVLGPEVEEFEAELARFAGSAHAIGISSGTDALLIALLAEGIGAGAAVFVPAFSFAATAGAVVAAGAEPVFVDVDPRTYNIDPQDLERRIARVGAEGRLRPRAVIAVDLFGLPADYAALDAVAKRHGLFLLADAAQSFGASLAGVRVGRLAPVTATSFYPTKPLACYGDGGALLT
ncbi:MAG: DegT/DnrJ/EryC1/StrS aminotransferase family protein, partial [Alphaproteobacteria bacterium]